MYLHKYVNRYAIRIFKECDNGANKMDLGAC